LHDANKPALETYQYWLGVKAKSDLLLYGFPKDAFKFGSGHAASWLYDKLSGKLIVGLQPPIDLRPDGSVRFSQYSVFMHDFVEDRSKSFDQVPIAAARVEHVAYDQAARKIVGALAYSKEVIIWNEDDYKIEQRFSTSDKVASLHLNGIIQSWDIQNAAQMQFTGDASIQITYDPKREQIYACSSVCLSIFSAATGKRIQSVQGEFKQGFFFDSQCDALIACSSDHCIAKYELQNLKVERTFAVPEDERIRLYHYDEISRRIIAVAGAATKENLCIWDSMTGFLVGNFEIPAPTEIKAIHYIPASRLIATLDTSGSLRIWSEGNDPVIEHPNVCRRHGEKYTLDIDVERGRILAAGYKSRSRVPLRYWESVF
jgi:WD40 repeat protein